MPILTMSVKRSPLRAANRGLHVWPRAKAATFSRSASDGGHDVYAVDQDRLAGKIAQRHMQRRAFFGGVDLLAGKQGGAARLEAGGAGEVEQMPQGRAGQAVLRIVVDQVVEPCRKMLETHGDRRRRDQCCAATRFRRDGLREPQRRRRRRCDPCLNPVLRFPGQVTARRGKTTAYWRLPPFGLAVDQNMRFKGAWLLPFSSCKASASLLAASR